jgi:UDP-N-acetylmuramoyl-L-alanyl-D-glutamate--2,6-diaminopimelate ligase
VKFSRLASALPDCEVIASNDPEITRIDYDSRQAEPGSLFIAIPGEVSDGHNYISKAVENGAVAVVAQWRFDKHICKNAIIVPESRTAMAILSSELMGHPDRDLNTIGVTGTNGKTTTISILFNIFKERFGNAGMIGTLGGQIGDETFTLERTTPESPDIYKLLAKMQLSGCKAAAMEVSSHALALKRVYGMRFRVAAFTNFSQDHLDFHGDLESYFLTKASLFQEYDVEDAVINIDDSYGRRVQELTDIPTLTYSLSASADIAVEKVDYSMDGIRMTALTPNGRLSFTSPLIGTFNASNLLCALAVSEVMDIPHDCFKKAVSKFSGVPGRMERIEIGNRWIYIDYSHTPEALALALKELRRIVPGEVHVLFGCGGNRDQQKRPLMGKAADEFSDKVYITTDNPRDEDPGHIIDDIMEGIKHSENTTRIIDRREAINCALSNLPEKGGILIAGKGHEKYQEIKGVRYPMDDHEEVHNYIANTLK